MHADLKLFVYALWKHLSLPRPTKVQLAIIEYLANGPRRRMISAFRGVGKSWLTAAFVLWRLWRDPEEKILVISAAENKSIEFATFAKLLIAEVPFLTQLRARDGQRDSTLAFDVGPTRPAQAPSVRAVGIGGQITGGRATLIVVDDVEIPSNSETETKREKLAARIAELGGAVLSPNGEVVYLGTPQSIQTIYAGLPEKGYDVRLWPARFWDGIDAESGTDVHRGRLCPQLKAELEAHPELLGTPTDPERFDEGELQEREAEYGPSGFRLQYQLDTSLSDANRYPLRQRDLIVMDLSTEIAPVQLAWASSPDLVWGDIQNVGLNGDRLFRPLYVSEQFTPYTGAVMFVDPAGRGKDETAYCVTKTLNGWVFVLAWGGLPGGYDGESVLKPLARIAQDHKVNAVHIEENFGDGMFSALLGPVMQEIHPCHMEEFKVGGVFKEKRICDKLEPPLSSHRVVMDRSVAEANSRPTKELPSIYLGLYQLALMTRDRGALKHDDRADVLAEAVGFWTKALARNNKESEKEHKEKLLLREIQKHQEQCRALQGLSSNRSGIRWATKGRRRGQGLRP
jgi:hypothetical protein